MYGVPNYMGNGKGVYGSSKEGRKYEGVEGAMVGRAGVRDGVQCAKLLGKWKRSLRE